MRLYQLVVFTGAWGSRVVMHRRNSDLYFRCWNNLPGKGCFDHLSRKNFMRLEIWASFHPELLANSRALMTFFLHPPAQRDENVEELDKLRSHPDSSEDVIAFAERLEDSLKKLHDTNPHHEGEDEKPPKVRAIQAWNINYFSSNFLCSVIPGCRSLSLRSKCWRSHRCSDDCKAEGNFWDLASTWSSWRNHPKRPTSITKERRMSLQPPFMNPEM